MQITIPLGGEAEARRFYCDLFGLREIPKPEPLRARGGFWLEVGTGQQIHIGVEDGVDRTATRAHVAYVVDDAGALRDDFARRGIETRDGIPIDGMIRFDLRDPFGNRVEIVQLTPNASERDA